MSSSPATDEDPLALHRQLCFALSLASRSVVAAYRPVLEPMRLTHPQYLVMLALWEREPLSLKELGGLLSMDSGTLSPLLKRLEGIGYLRRSRTPEDERILAVSLTEEGRALRAEAEGIPETIQDRLGLSAEEVKDVHTAMVRLIEHTGRA